MPFIPHTPEDRDAMLAEIGAADINALFDEIPVGLRSKGLAQMGPGKSEMDMLAWFRAMADKDHPGTCFTGAGSYDHHIPAAVWDLTSRGEFMTAYTPYQAEASQGTLQLIYEYQSMMCELTGMEVSNASVYDGASGLAESILMAVRANKKNKSRRVLLAGAVHPLYFAAARNLVKNQQIQLQSLALNSKGQVDLSALEEQERDQQEAPVALVIQQPGFFGTLEEEVDALTDWAASRNALVIAVVNPLALSLLEPPGQWGQQGADIVCGDGQPLGIPMASGGPSFGFMCTRQSLVRQMPGRIIGRTQDNQGRSGFTLTLQAREQHIRRAKATSNICTNQGLLVTAATIHMSLLGAQGLRRVAVRCHNNTASLVQQLAALPGVSHRFEADFFHEAVVKLPRSADAVRAEMSARGIQAGLALGDYFTGPPDLSDCLLVCATEKRTSEEIDNYVRQMAEVLA